VSDDQPKQWTSQQGTAAVVAADAQRHLGQVE